MFKKVATAIVLLSATSLTLIQTQQPAQAGILDDLQFLLKMADTGAELGEGLNRATNSDGSVDVRQIIRSSQRAVERVQQTTDDYSASEYQAEKSEYEPADTSEVQQSEDEPEEAVAEDEEPVGQYEDSAQ
jgi:hypothetical protein